MLVTAVGAISVCCRRSCPYKQLWVLSQRVSMERVAVQYQRKILSEIEVEEGYAVTVEA